MTTQRNYRCLPGMTKESDKIINMKFLELLTNEWEKGLNSQF
jgi:hypothetical protein